ncbi:transcriptional regulator, MerR family [Beutenbergia cavernae DSM 12333]|uniref:Transcriptional regulator, MerR family n=1 Tax=Beutenbergia cavernae (strain ATCC BAA-8 / DSM 12333 / CCUG 43141 / JCM 11478 / NBRC 16432 / NCIMB 13614 / HKI 0122) TaxID=471853 RepID=C5C3C0_BEUC1|nr:MerR family transcriptional regulator [Beutenbergia cavernae]ACQ79819.1 transcriptional regulator, MerR family [Beutenbergia cavernae DSM 12333]
MRIGDVAGPAGVSTQHVRDLERLEIIPRSVRSANGYRSYTRTHSTAVVAYRALVAGFGVAQARAVMRAVTADDVERALELVDLGHVAQQGARETVRLASRALDALAAEPERDVRAEDDMTVGELAGALGVRTSTLRSWEAYRLLVPARDARSGHRRYSPDIVRAARIVHQLRLQGVRPAQIRAVLAAAPAGGEVVELRRVMAERRGALGAASLAMLDAAAALRDHLAARQADTS